MSAIEICPICGKETLSINFNNKTREKVCICSECNFKHEVKVAPTNIKYQENLAFLQFFGNAYKHVVHIPELTTLAEVERRMQEIEHINGIQSIELVVIDKETGHTMIVSGEIPEV